MAKIMVHITHGTEHPTRAVLGFHVAKAALEAGHEVTLFLAGDGVQLMREGAIEHLNGLGTGNMRQIYDAVVENGARIYLSGMSAKSRGLGPKDLEGKSYTFAGPPELVKLSLEHDRLFTY